MLINHLFPLLRKVLDHCTLMVTVQEVELIETKKLQNDLSLCICDLYLQFTCFDHSHKQYVLYFMCFTLLVLLKVDIVSYFS